MKHCCLLLVFAFGLVVSNVSCGSDTKKGGDVSEESTKMGAQQPVNLSVYLDLSDRLERQMTPSQADRDTAIIMYLAAKLKERAVQQKILPSKERIKIFFYPSPTDTKVALLSDKLELDLGKLPVQQKKARLVAFEQEFRESLKQMYASTIQTKNWEGSDIWGFFNKNVDNYCIHESARNVLFILTDGYIYHKGNLIQKDGAFSYIPEVGEMKPLIVNRQGLENLEVLILEVNPRDMKQEPKMEKILTDWLKGMGVKNSYVGETDLPSNTRLIIDKFLGF